MNEDVLNARLAEKPLLTRQYIVTPIVVRQEHWVIIKNPISGAFVRLQSDLWAMVQQLDGSCSLQQWLQTHSSMFGDRQLLAAVLQLNKAGILSAQLDDSLHNAGVAGLMTKRSPLMIRVPLFNPSRLLSAVCRCTARLRARTVFRVLALVYALALYALTMNWQAVSYHWSQIDSATVVWHFLLLYPLTKCLHELAHGWAMQRLGREVPEAGISLIVLFPMPYVDATDAWSLQRRQRMLVTCAGMLMDLLVASVSIVAWLVLSSGVLADMLFSVAVMGVVSVFLFNANPLLKFDGYYLLEDALDSPGLARRAMAYYRYLGKRYCLLIARCTPPVLAPGEIPWLLSYGLLSLIYRFFIVAIISYYLISTFHEIGVLLSLFALIPLCVSPIVRFVHFLGSSSELADQRRRTVCVTAGLGLLVAGFVLTVPLPSTTRTQGVVWVHQQAEVFAALSGQLENILVENGDLVTQGQPLMTLHSDELLFELEQKRTAVRLAQLQASSHRYSDPGRARLAVIGLRQAQSELDVAIRQSLKLSIVAPVSGRIAMSGAQTRLGASVQQGKLLAYVVDDEQRVVRTVVDQNAIGMIESGVQQARVRLAQNMSVSRFADIAQQIPSGNHDLPSAALIDTGFGGFKVEPATSESSVQTRDKVFHLELVLRDSLETESPVPMGTRAFVTLEHADEPLAARWIRLSRQLLIKHLKV